MKELYPKLREADVVVIASPIYWFTVSAQTKLFMDRWYALGRPKGHSFAGKRFGIVLAYSNSSDVFTSGAVNALRTLQDALHFVEASSIGMVYGNAGVPGGMEKNKDLMAKAYKMGEELLAD